MAAKKSVSAEDKQRAVEDYLHGDYTLREIGEKYQVHHSNISKWLLLYKIWGKEGLERPKKNSRYTEEFKQEVIATYLNTNCSLYDLCRQYKVRNFSTVQAWLSKIEGAQAKSKTIIE